MKVLEDLTKKETSKLTRVEIISPEGREVVKYFAEGFISIQDDGRTLKVFITKE